MYKIIAFFIMSLFLISCEDSNKVNNIDKKLDRTGTPIIITVRYFKTENELKRAYQEVHGLSNSVQIPDQYGFARWPEWKNKNGESVEKPELYRCDIYALEPKRQDDKNVTTLGHELMHCLHGSYHK